MLTVDLWRWVVLPAMTRDRSRVERALGVLDAEWEGAGGAGCAEGARRDALAARALLAVGAVGVGMARARRALLAGDGEAVALARVAFPEGEGLAARGLWLGRPGESADAGCDQAWRCLLRGDMRGAEGALVVALQICPDHAEARRWWGLVSSVGADLLDWMATPEEAPLSMRADLVALLPSAAQGWLSWERLHRRPQGHVLPPPQGGTGLDRLVDAGVWARHLGTDADYSAMAEDDLRVEVELALDAAWTTQRSGRPVGAAMQAVWRAAGGLAPAALQAVAASLVSMGLADPSGQATGLAAAEVMVRARPQEPRWAASRARLLAATGAPTAAREARAVLQRGTVDLISWRLAVETLQQTGCPHEVTRAARRALREPALAPAAAGFLRGAGAGAGGGEGWRRAG